MILSAILITLFADFLLGYRTHYKIVEKMEEAHVVPDVIDKPPPFFMEVQFKAGPHVYLGKVIRPLETAQVPKYVQWTKQKYALHTVCMIDTGSNVTNTTTKQWLSWMVINMRDNKIDTGNTVSSYVGTLPEENSGLNRYVFLAYKQPRTLKIDDPSLEDISDGGRGNFSVREFAKKYRLGEPVAGNFFFSEWDKTVPRLKSAIEEKFDDTTVRVTII